MRGVALVLLLVSLCGQAAADGEPVDEARPTEVDGSGARPNEAERPARGSTVQRRYAPTAGTVALHGLGTTHVRGDFFYHQVGGGLSATIYPEEGIGIELVGLLYGSWLTDSAAQLRASRGVIPDSRARSYSVLAGTRISIGYGKMQVFDGAILHFDPALVLRGGVTIAEERRVLPTALAGLGVLLHFDFGFQIQIDFLVLADLEDRNRGWVPSFGIAPSVAAGFRFGGRERE